MHCIKCSGQLTPGIPGDHCLACRPAFMPSLNTPLTMADSPEDAHQQRERYTRLEKGIEFPGYRHP